MRALVRQSACQDINRKCAQLTNTSGCLQHGVNRARAWHRHGRRCGHNEVVMRQTWSANGSICTVVSGGSDANPPIGSSSAGVWTQLAVSCCTRTSCEVMILRFFVLSLSGVSARQSNSTQPLPCSSADTPCHAGCRTQLTIYDRTTQTRELLTGGHTGATMHLAW
jgi:hypothetical protein